MNAENYLRVGFSGRLHCLSPLHVGDGGLAASKDRPANDRKSLTKGHYNTVCLDHRNRPYIPGSTLRGALLALLNAADPALTAALSGDRDRAGKLRVGAACLGDTHPKLLELPYWNPERGTYLHQGVGIEPVTRTANADSHALFQHEVVAPGAVFGWRIWLEHPSPEMVELLKNTLDNWRGQWSCAIGHGRGQGWGRLRYELDQIETLSAADLGEWLARDADEVPYKVENFSPQDGDAPPDPGGLRLSLVPQTPFLINEAYFAVQKDVSDQTPDLAFNRTADHRALIPGSTLKGWLRNRAHKIAATIVHQHFKVAVKDAWERVQPMIQDLFGKEEFRSQLWIGEAVSDKPAGILTFMMNAIDRFTGGVSVGDSYNLPKRGGALFKVEAADCDRLECWVEWDRRRAPRPDDWQKGLLLLVARDALEGELRLGWGQAKGFGDFAVQLHYGVSPIDNWEALLKALREAFGDQSPEIWVTELHQELKRRIQAPQTPVPTVERAAA